MSINLSISRVSSCLPYGFPSVLFSLGHAWDVKSLHRQCTRVVYSAAVVIILGQMDPQRSTEGFLEIFKPENQLA